MRLTVATHVMNRLFPRITCAALLLVLPCLAAAAGDDDLPVPPPVPPPVTADSVSTRATPSAEQALLERLQQGSLGADYLELDAAEGRFLARYAQPRDGSVPQAALLLLPGPARLISAEPVIDAVFEEFTNSDWAVMAVQPVVLAPTAELDDYATVTEATHARLAAACSHLAADGISRLVVFAFEGGTAVALGYVLAGAAPVEIAALASRGYWQGELVGFDRPVLEFIADSDQGARHASQQRHVEARRAGQIYRLVELPMVVADDAFAGALISRQLRGWAENQL